MNHEQDRAAVEAEVFAELKAAGLTAAQLDRLAMSRATPTPAAQVDDEAGPTLDDMDGLLTLGHTLRRFACIVTDHTDRGAVLTLPQIVAFVATLSELELLALSRLEDVGQVASVTLAHLSVGQRAAIVRGLHSIADAVVDVAVDVIGLAEQ